MDLNHQLRYGQYGVGSSSTHVFLRNVVQEIQRHFQCFVNSTMIL